MKIARLKAAIGINVRTFREKRDWSQEELAEAIGRTYQAVGNIERGVALPPLSTLNDLATALGIPLQVLLSEDVLPPSDHRADLMAQAETILDDLSDSQLETAVKMLTVLREGLKRG